MKSIILSLLVLSLLITCTQFPVSQEPILTTTRIIVTSESGDNQAVKPNVAFTRGEAQGTVIQLFPDQTKQTLDGIGSSFTESSAFVLATLTAEKRAEVMRKIYSEDGANFTLTRTHIGACDFSVEGKYSYAEEADDAELASFTLDPDLEGFSRDTYPEIKDESYDLLPMILEAQAIKVQQADPTLRIVGSAWTAPAWMKDNEAYYTPMLPENNYQGTGGTLKPQYVQTYADYLLKYLNAYKAKGVNLWGLTPVNEPHGNNGQWESMNFSPESQSVFVQNHMGPTLRKGGFGDVKIMIFDQNRDGLEEWANTLFPADKEHKYIYGAAVHWYASTVEVFEETFEKVHADFPDYAITHTEGCIDDLGKPAPAECTDPEGRTEKDWFMNDSFWWNKTATDWGYAVPWTPNNGESHPMYTPVHRYARNIIVGIDHWLTGWIDWNIVLDSKGGPNHVGNFCGAPIMIDTKTSDIHYTPVFQVLSQFSRSIRPGDQAIQTKTLRGELGDDDLHACATVNADGLLSVQLLNTTKAPLDLNLQLGELMAAVQVPANAVETVQIQL